MNLTRAFALVSVAMALALAALACEDDSPPPQSAPASEPIVAVPTNAPAPTPTAVPTNTPAPVPTAVPTSAPAPMPTAITPSVQPRNFAVRRIYDANIDAVRIYGRAIGALSRSSSYRMQLNESIDFGDGRKMKASTDTYFQFHGKDEERTQARRACAHRNREHPYRRFRLYEEERQPVRRRRQWQVDSRTRERRHSGRVSV